MSNEVEAVYENGVFRPLEPVDCEEQQRVRVLLPQSTDNGQSTDSSDANPELDWTREENRRRCELISKRIDGAISSDEQAELEHLQQRMLTHRRKAAPLPIEDLQQLHQELLEEALKNKGDTLPGMSKHRTTSENRLTKSQ